MWWPELALLLNRQVVVAAVVLFNMEVEHSLVVEALTTGAYQRGQPEVVQQAVEYQPGHRHEVLVAGLTLLEEIHRFHGFVPHILAVVCMLEPVSSDFAAVQTDQVEGMSSVHVLLHICEITPHPRKRKIQNLG